MALEGGTLIRVPGVGVPQAAEMWPERDGPAQWDFRLGPIFTEGSNSDRRVVSRGVTCLIYGAFIEVKFTYN